MEKIARDFVLICVLFAVGWLGFYFYTKEAKKTISQQIISDENEEKIGKFFKHMVFQEYDTLPQHPNLKAQVNQIQQRLTQAMNDSSKNYQVHILDSDQINAFVITGNEIYVFKGLIDFCDSPEMLAGVLAHESGHLVHHDFIHRLLKEVSMSALLAIITGGDPSLMAEMGKKLFALEYDRDQERSADKFASKLLIKANIHPKAMTQFFLKLQREEPQIPENLHILSTHPHLKERVEQSLEFTVPDDFEEKKFEFEWQNINEIEAVN